MRDALSLALAVEEAWADVPAPSLRETPLTAGNLNQEEADTFLDVSPMKVDIDSVGFLAATPLDDLPPRAAAAYLGTFLRAVMMSLHEQQAVNFFADPLTRAHVITCLKEERFWAAVVMPHIAGKQREVLLDVMHCMVHNREDLGLDDADVDVFRARIAAASMWRGSAPAKKYALHRADHGPVRRPLGPGGSA
jgi:hypothetical protein